MTLSRNNNPFKGACPALVTPFCSDGSIDFSALRNLVRRAIEGGMNFLCVLGTTAETPTLSRAEQIRVRECVALENAGRLPLLLGFGGNNTAAMVEDLKVGNFEGYDALLIVTPFYNKPNQEGLFQHYRTIAEASPLPIILYNVPGRTGVNLLPETVLRIANECPNVIGIKEATGNVDQAKSILAGRPKGFSVLSGDDATACDLMEAGADGVISVLANARPDEVSSIIHDKENRREIDSLLRKYYAPLFKEGNPAGIKAMLYLEGRMQNVLRLPLVPASDSLIQEIKKLL